MWQLENFSITYVTHIIVLLDSATLSINSFFLDLIIVITISNK